MTTFTKDTLPKTYLKPPFSAPYTQNVTNRDEVWRRDWSVYYIHTHWEGSDWGKLGAIRDWLSKVSGKSPVSKQRIQNMVMQVHYLLRHNMEWDDQTREIIDRYTPTT